MTPAQRLRLAYGDLLLTLLRRELAMSALRGVDQPRIDGLCDRFERLRASLLVSPLLWEGDCA